MLLSCVNSILIAKLHKKWDKKRSVRVIHLFQDKSELSARDSSNVHGKRD